MELPQDGRVGRGEGRQQVNAGNLAVGTAAKGFAVEGQVLAGPGPPSLQPQPQGPFQRSHVEDLEQFAEGGGGRGLGLAETEGVGQPEAVIAAELGDGLERAAANADGHGVQAQHGHERMLPATPIGDEGECFSQG